MKTFYVKVTTGEDECHVDTSGAHPHIALTAPAEQGRANAELVKRLTTLLGTNVGIVSGHTSRRKKLAVDLEQGEIDARLEEESTETA